MNTRSSSSSQKNSSFHRGRGARSSSASRNNISIELGDSNSGTKPKVVHSPATKISAQTQRTESLNSLPTQIPFQETQVMDSQILSSEAQIFSFWFEY